MFHQNKDIEPIDLIMELIPFRVLFAVLLLQASLHI